ncbi:MAG: hypothetical protein GY870_18390, partial [archaeon]|nr:hypothetical protein [archaeon]
MNSLERVRAAINFKKPDRAPIINVINGDAILLPIIPSKNWRPGWLEGEEGLFPYFLTGKKWDRPDWAKNNPEYEGEKWRTIPHEEVDEWGCIWNLSGRNDTIGHPGRPSLLDWADFDEYFKKYNLDPTDSSRFSLIRSIQKSMKEEKYNLILLNFGPLEVAYKLRGFSRYLVDHKRHPEEVRKLLNHLTNYFLNLMEATVKNNLNPHGFLILEDWGEQNNPYLSPKLFKKFYEPVYKPLIEKAHDLGCEFHIHSCGKIDKLLPAFIEWGLDAIEFDSPRMSGYPDLAPYRGKIMMWGCVNIQSIYPNGTKEEVEREVWH